MSLAVCSLRGSTWSFVLRPKILFLPTIVVYLLFRPSCPLHLEHLSVVLHTAVAWQTVNELACGESGIVHGAECIAVLNGVA